MFVAYPQAGFDHPAIRFVALSDMLDGETEMQAAQRIAQELSGIVVESLPDAPQEAWRIMNGGLTVVDLPAPSQSSVPVLYAVGNFKVANADISGIDTAVNFSAAMWMDVGNYLVLFSETQPNTEYLAKAYSGTCQALVVEKGEDYLIINASNGSGSFDPAEFSLEVIRVQ